MKSDSSDWTIMFIELLQECTYPVVPQLDNTGVQTETRRSLAILKYFSNDKSNLANTQGRFWWNESPLTRADFVSKLVSIVNYFYTDFSRFSIKL